MTIKEFSHKHSLVFFWATVVLAVILLLTCIAGLSREGRYYPGYMMRGGVYNNNDSYNGYNRRGQMMNRQQRPIYNNGAVAPTEEIDGTFSATGTIQ